ncbi:calpastatin isoform X3 [Anolis carolinensis]|uniref:calpastatin isoform X3 n=1 Tax=Anolis carolinensis TaxID=28377 RepID=UPI002F2B63EE
MSQPTKGKKHAAKAGKTHADKSASGASGDKKASETTEKKTPAESPKTQTSGTSPVTKVPSSSTVAPKTTAMKPSETKAAQKLKAESEKAAELAKLDDSQAKHPPEEKQKDPGGEKSPSKPSVVTQPKPLSPGKAAQMDKAPVQLTSKEEAKVKTDKKPLAGQAAVAATGGGITAPDKTAASVDVKENKLAATTPAAADSKPAEKSDLDAALDDLIDTLGSPEESQPTPPAYTGSQISEGPLTSLYIEELGKRESSIPPEYRKLLESKGDDKVVPPPAATEKSQPTMTDDDLADALSSDFASSPALPAGEKSVVPKEKKPAEEGDLLLAESATFAKGAAPSKEKKPKLEEIGDMAALDALVDTLGMPEPEPEVDLSSIVEVEEPKAKERREKKPGEDDDTIPPEYRLKPTLDKDGKPLLPEPEEKPKPISESDLIDEFSKDFDSPPPPPPAEVLKPSKPADASVKPGVPEPPKVPKGEAAASPAVPTAQPSAPSGVPTKPSTAESKKKSTEEVVSVAAAPSMQSSAPLAVCPSAPVPDDALEALSGSLGKREPEPKEKKPAVDKVKEKNKKEEREKLGEDEETIPPDYRLTETKDKDGKPLLPTPEEKPKPLSESELLDALSEGFSSSPSPTSKAVPAASPQKSKGPSKPAAASTEEVVSSASAPAVHLSAPSPAATPNRKELDDAADHLADSLGQREPDPNENKPVVDKIKEKAKSEHRDKLGERDDTIPPEYRHLLDSDEKGKPIKPSGKVGEKTKDKKKPPDDSAAIDALSGDFDNSGKPPVSQQPSPKDEKTKDAPTSKSARKDEKKSKSAKKAKEQSSSAKSEKQKKS